MTFLEFHQYVKQDSLMYSWITDKFYLSRKKIEASEKITVNKEEVIIMEKGLLVQESDGEKPVIHRVFADHRIIFTIQDSFQLTALETSTYSIIPTEKLFSELDASGLLSNFFLQIAEDLERDLERDKKLRSVSPEERANIVLALIINHYKIDPVENPDFPKWLRVNVLAKLAKCPVSTASQIMRELMEKGVSEIPPKYGSKVEPSISHPSCA